MQSTLTKLFVSWCLLMLAVPVAFFWFRPGIVPDHEFEVFAKLLLLVGLAVAAGLTFTYTISKRWVKRTATLQRFADALPAGEADLPDGGPEELQSLAKAMRAMASRVRQVVDRANLELSRRETILACMAEGVLAVDNNLKVNFCNEAFASAFNARTPVVEGRNLYEVVREPVLRDILERVVKTGTPERDLFRLPSAAGRWFEARALPLGNKLIRGAVIALHDVTDIERQEQVRKDFVADVSHELRTPLTAIRGYAETLLDGGLEDGANNRKFVETILSHSIRLANIASDLLVISELDSNAGPVAPSEKVPIMEVIESACNTVEGAAAAKRVRIVRDDCLPCAVLGYRFRLEQVIVNLLDNAVKFNKNDGEILIECGPAPDGKVRVSVSDTGIGVPSEELKRIFERFYRVDKSRSRAAGGTGLGLPIVKELVERMNGTVTVESTLGRGTKFTILLESA